MTHSTRHDLSWLIIAFTFLTFSSGCDDSDSTDALEQDAVDATPDGSSDSFVPFSEDNLQSQLLRVASFHTISDLRASATLANASEVYAQILAEYQSNSLQDKVAGRGDDHSYALAGDIGAFLDTQMVRAISLGSQATTDDELAWAGQSVSKLLLVFFYHSVYHELFLRTRLNLDEAFGYYGLSFDGSETTGLADTAAKREVEQSVAINAPILDAFIAAHAIVGANTSENEDTFEDAAYDAHMAEIDRLMLLTFAYGIIHEMDELLDGDPADVKLIEARLFWEALQPYALSIDGATAQAMLAELYPGDAPPARDAEGLYFSSGLEAIGAGERLVAADLIMQYAETIVQTLE